MKSILSQRVFLGMSRRTPDTTMWGAPLCLDDSTSFGFRTLQCADAPNGDRFFILLNHRALTSFFVSVLDMKGKLQWTWEMPSISFFFCYGNMSVYTTAGVPEDCVTVGVGSSTAFASFHAASTRFEGGFREQRVDRDLYHVLPRAPISTTVAVSTDGRAFVEVCDFGGMGSISGASRLRVASDPLFSDARSLICRRFHITNASLCNLGGETVVCALSGARPYVIMYTLELQVLRTVLLESSQICRSPHFSFISTSGVLVWRARDSERMSFLTLDAPNVKSTSREFDGWRECFGNVVPLGESCIVSYCTDSDRFQILRIGVMIRPERYHFILANVLIAMSQQ